MSAPRLPQGRPDARVEQDQAAARRMSAHERERLRPTPSRRVLDDDGGRDLVFLPLREALLSARRRTHGGESLRVGRTVVVASSEPTVSRPMRDLLDLAEVDGYVTEDYGQIDLIRLAVDRGWLYADHVFPSAKGPIHTIARWRLTRSGVAALRSIEQAERAGYTYVEAGKRDGSWQKDPETMLFWRCGTRAARRWWPDVVAGVYSVEEMTDVERAEGRAA